ncbi:hypothetical protein [Alienimonas chondri]|uniref:Uncharacterized protein n=1 Tax=Alienimonas chondri TaxID=2681879 RepID=A0ABX1V949_9PLAN|nr:hypothetical protein [Alienimonas chondri]NNJ24628.1 hypothetical protein [Alienimonas chondri]
MTTATPPPTPVRPPTAKALFKFHPHTWTLWMMATPLLMGIALFFDFFPRLGSPAFDAAGVPTGEPVYNLGFPLVTALYAPNVGFRLGPLGWPVFATQFLLYLACTGVVWAWQHAAKEDA